MVGTHEDRVKDKNELQRRVDHINGYLQKWISHSANLKVANANFFKEREDGVYRKGDIPQIDWIEEYIPLPRKKNIFLDAHHPKNIPCGKQTYFSTSSRVIHRRVLPALDHFMYTVYC